MLFGLSVCTVTAACLFLPAQISAQSRGLIGNEIPSIEEKTSGMDAMEGFFNLYWDESTGHLYWEIDRWEEEFLYAVSLSSGLGSNPVGLDRGQHAAFGTGDIPAGPEQERVPPAEDEGVPQECGDRDVADVHL